MRPFKYTRAADASGAVRSVSSTPTAEFLAGGSNILDLLKEDVMRPTELVDLTRLNLTQIKAVNGGLSLGALATNTDTANHPLVRQNYPLLSQGILAGASGQLTLWNQQAPLTALTPDFVGDASQQVSRALMEYNNGDTNRASVVEAISRLNSALRELLKAAEH